jgi:hypothetical protein
MQANNETITFPTSIWNCEQELRKLGYPPASVTYLVSRVGTNEQARVYLEGLSQDPNIGNAIYVSPADLMAKMNVFRVSQNNIAYTNQVWKFLSW